MEGDSAGREGIGQTALRVQNGTKKMVTMKVKVK